jgi:hypothetical protein
VGLSLSTEVELELGGKSRDRKTKAIIRKLNEGILKIINSCNNEEP